MNFEEALSYLKQGEKIYREKWKDSAVQFIYLKDNIIFEIFYQEDILKTTTWFPSHEDLLASDWKIFIKF